MLENLVGELSQNNYQILTKALSSASIWGNFNNIKYIIARDHGLYMQAAKRNPPQQITC